MMRDALIIAAALGIELFGIWAGTRLGLSQFYAVGVGFVPAMLVVFPVVRDISRRNLRFSSWGLTVTIICIAASLLHLIMRS
jgi:hypothetical protein